MNSCGVKCGKHGRNHALRKLRGTARRVTHPKRKSHNMIDKIFYVPDFFWRCAEASLGDTAIEKGPHNFKVFSIQLKNKNEKKWNIWTSPQVRAYTSVKSTCLAYETNQSCLKSPFRSVLYVRKAEASPARSPPSLKALPNINWVIKV